MIGIIWLTCKLDEEFAICERVAGRSRDDGNVPAHGVDGDPFKHCVHRFLEYCQRTPLEIGFARLSSHKDGVRECDGKKGQRGH